MDYYINILCSLGIPACTAVFIVKDYYEQDSIEELINLIDALEAKDDYAWEGVTNVYSL